MSSGTAVVKPVSGEYVNANQHSKIKALFLSTMLSAGLLFSVQTSAHDTEIFFANEIDSADSTPNVLFMFDTSGSMAEYDSGPTTRLSRLKEAMTTVVESSENVNIAIGSFAGSNNGSIQLPAIGVDDDVCPNASCNSLKIRGEITRDEDDGVLLTNNTVDLDSNGLTLNNSIDTWALRFDDLNIPRGATINSAQLQLISRGDHYGTTTMVIIGEATDDSAPLVATSGNIISRKAPGNSTTAQATWTPGTWFGWIYGRNAYFSDDLSTIVSEITDRAGWCGGNALTLLVSSTGAQRIAHSRDSDPYIAPVLQIDYDPSSVDWSDTCVRSKSISNIALGINDVVQDTMSGAVVADGDQLRTHVGTSPQAIGLRFTDIEIPPNATITTAYLKLPLTNSIAGNVDLMIEVEDTSYSTAINPSVSGALTSRNFMNNSIIWEDVPDNGSTLQSVDISSMVSDVVAKAGWSSDGAMTFSLTPTATSTGQRFFSSENSPSDSSATLVVQFQQDSADLGGVPPVLATGRDEMIRTMMDYESTGGTPLVNAYYESSQYMRGEAVVYGDQPASGNYTKPEFGECSASQIVLLSDGEANNNVSVSAISSLIQGAPTAGTTTPTCANRSNASETCGIELATWLSETDHDDQAYGIQPIQTHTIGFNTTSPFLTSIAEAGDGSYYQASTATDLAFVFKNIIQSAAILDTSFVAPSSSINLSNRLVNSGELYFALFKPSTTTHWDGNIKRYEFSKNLSNGNVELRDSMATLATNPDGTIKSTSKSFWSANTDGADVGRGGAASRLTLTRNLYTSMYDADTSKITLKTFHENNLDIDTEALGIQGKNNAYRIELLKWARGVDIKDYDEDSNITEVRAQMGDVLHSAPSILHYPDLSLIFAGTNQGFLHAIDISNGDEIFAYIPEQLFSNLDYFYRDEPTKHDRRPHGLDGEITSWHDDSNGNGLVDGSEKAYIYLGMRRGGRNYYALDVTDPSAPEFAWMIKGGEGQFTELGQTWSRPVKATVHHQGEDKNVLFFAGGYDEANDTELQRTVDTVGRGIFMVDAALGTLIADWDASDFSGMDYSIPSDLRIINPDDDKYADMILVGDTGGQLWRFDINNDPSNNGSFFTGHIMADVAGTPTTQNRKFFYEPDVALIKNPEGGMALNVAIGTGSRPNPNSVTVEDSFYAFRGYDIYGPPRDANGAIVYPETITEDDLVDTSQVLGSSDTADNLQTGWFFRFPAAGEKALSTALTVDNELMFTTYAPAAKTEDICTATVGSGQIYTLNVFNGDPAGGSEILSDRHTKLDQPGIPPRVMGVILEASPNSITTIVGTQTIGEGSTIPVFERTFWAEQ